MKENINVLDEINKGASMGITSISYIIDKVEDKHFKHLLEAQKEEYEDITKEINNLYKKYNKEDTPHELNSLEKAMTWFDVEARTINSDDSKIASLLFKGTNMGIIEGRKILNDKKMDTEVEKITNKFVEMQEKNIEDLKKYL